MKPYQLALKLEENWERLNQKERSQKIEELSLELSKLNTPPARPTSSTLADDDPSLEKLKALTRCLKPEMTLKDFYSVLVPLERYHNRKVTDSSFLVRDQDRKEKTHSSGELVVILDNLRSAFNVGSIARISDCVGAKAIYYTGYTPGPENTQVQKSALGSELSLEWKHFPRLKAAIEELQSQDYQVFALETAQASSVFASKLKSKSALVLGNERFGIDEANLSLCDGVLEIPTFGIKNSLNVATSYAVSAYEWKRQQSPELFN